MLYVLHAGSLLTRNVLHFYYSFTLVLTYMREKGSRTYIHIERQTGSQGKAKGRERTRKKDRTLVSCIFLYKPSRICTYIYLEE